MKVPDRPAIGVPLHLGKIGFGKIGFGKIGFGKIGIGEIGRSKISWAAPGPAAGGRP
jgi:hypothetical protein